MIENVITSLASNMATEILRNGYERLKVMAITQPRRPRMADLECMKRREIGRTIDQLYLFQEYTIDNTTMSRLLTDPFYDLSIELIRNLNIKEEYFDNYKKTFGADHVTNKFELVGYLLREKEQPKRNDSRYLMGFRTIHCILMENLDKIDINYIDHINKKLEPFYQKKSKKHWYTIYLLVKNHPFLLLGKQFLKH